VYSSRRITFPQAPCRRYLAPGLPVGTCWDLLVSRCVRLHTYMLQAALSFVRYFTKLWVSRIHGVECYDDWWILDWNGLESKGYWHNRSLSPYLSGGTEENRKILSQDNWYPGRNSKQAPSEYKSRTLLLHQISQSVNWKYNGKENCHIVTW
jgi:hypothetical protein